MFPAKYRKHTFLHHPKVPPENKQSVSQKYCIKSKLQSELLGDVHSADCIICIPNYPDNGASGQEILDNFGDVKESVLNFHSLYGAMDYSSDPLLGKDFVEKLNKACTPGKYRQF